MNTTTRTRTAIAAALLALALPLSLTSCSAGDDTASADGASSGVGAKWGSCMRDAGFDVEDPSDDLLSSGAVTMPQGVDEQAWGTAAGKCSDAAGVSRADTAQKQKWARQYDQVASCIRSNGYEDFPEQEEGTLNFGPESYPRAAEPGFEEVVQECLAEYAPDTKTQDAG